MSKQLVEQKCREAFLCLEQAQAQSENQSALLQQSLYLYLEAVDIAEPNDVTPYLGAAFVLGTVGMQEDAWGLLNQAKKLAPVNMRVEQMKRQLERMAKRNPPVGTVPLMPIGIDAVETLRSTPSSGSEFDDEIDILLKILTATNEQLKQWMN